MTDQYLFLKRMKIKCENFKKKKKFLYSVKSKGKNASLYEV